MEMYLTPKETYEVLKVVAKTENVVFIWGSPGIGKSSLCRQLANELKMELVHYDAPLLEPTDLIIPWIDKETKSVKLLTIDMIPQEKDDRAVLVLIDDLPHARPSQQIPLMELILDRRIGPNRIGKNVKFIVTGNEETDLAGTNSIISPVLNRMLHIYMAPDLEQWVDIMGAEIEEDILAYLRAFPQNFFNKPTVDAKAFPTPRSWHMLSKSLKVAEKKNDDLLRNLASATVGSATAASFMAFIKYLKNLNPRQIIEKAEIPTDSARDKLYAVITSVAGFLKQQGVGYLTKFHNNVYKFLQQLPAEFRVACMKELVRTPQGKNRTLLKKLVELHPDLLDQIEKIFGDVNEN